jgi:putative flippase GtrA
MPQNSKFSQLKSFLLSFLIPKMKFAISSSIATLVDYVLYMALVTYLFSPVISNIISAFTGMIINFILQKKFVFILNRKLSNAFLYSLVFSLVGIGISTSLIYVFNKVGFLTDYQYLIKLIVTAIVFFYNFYTKRFAFERNLFRYKKSV